MNKWQQCTARYACLLLVWVGASNAATPAHAQQPASADETPTTVLAAAIQVDSAFGEPEVNRERLLALAEQAAERGAKLIVLPETAVTGYMSDDIRTTWQVGEHTVTDGLIGRDPNDAAETVPGPSTDAFAVLSDEYDCYITVPILEVDRKTGRYYNTIVVVGPDGERAIHYRKRNPWQFAERGWAWVGNLGNPVIDTPYGRIGTIICFDIHEQGPIMAGLKVDHLLYCIAWVDVEDSDWFAVRLPERAAEHNLNIIGANWCLPQGYDGPAWHGHGMSRIIARDGTILAQAEDDPDRPAEILYAELPVPVDSQGEADE
ncbi:MAG: carbon-nitrogen hydrolase family protein [Phycisphaerales bacterium JB063]